MFDNRKTLVAKLIVGSVLVAAGPAWAGPKYTKKETEIKAVQTERTAPPRPKEQKKQGPNLKGDLFTPEQMQKRATQIRQINQAIIDKTKYLIDRTEDSNPDKPELMYRLAELYNENRQYFNFRARSLDEKVFQARGDGEKSRLKSEQASYEREENRWLLEAAKTYIQVANNPKFQQYPKMDEVLFYLGYMLQQVKRTDEARVFYGRLVKEHQGSKFVPNAYLSFGEYYFEQGDMNAALQFYDRIKKFPNSVVYGYALYKSGWAYYNLKDFGTSMKTFIDVIDLARQHKIDPANRAALEKECKKDIVLVYSQIGTPEKAWVFFQNKGGDYAPKMEERLAELYWEQGKFPESIKVYHELMRLFPDSGKLCEWQYNVAKNSLSAGSKRDQVTEMQRLSAVYDRFGRGEQKAAKPNEVAECKNNTADTLHELATVWHREAQKTRNTETYALAQYLYKEYVDKFPKEKDAYDMNWYYGELLFRLGEEEKDTAKQRWYWEKGADQYTKVVKLDPKGSHAQEAAYAAVIAYQNALAAQPDKVEQKEGLNTVDQLTKDCTNAPQETPKKGKGEKTAKKDKGKKDASGCNEAQALTEKYKPKPIPPDRQKMLDAFDTYLGNAKARETNEDQLIRIKYQRARTFYEFNHFDEAAPLFADIADKHPKHELAIYSANLLLDCLNVMGKFDAINKTVDKFVASSDLMKDAQFAAEMHKIKAETKWKQADELHRKHRYKDAAKLYVEVFNDAPEAPRAPQALANAAYNYDAARLVGQAIKIRQNLIKYKGETAEAKKALYEIGENYQGIAYYTKAAEFFEQFATKYPGEKEAADALSNATFFRRGLGDDQKAVDDNGLYIKFYGQRKPAEAAGVFWSIAAVYEKEHKWDDLLKHIQKFLSQYGSKRPDLQVLAHVKMGEILWRQSCPLGEGVNGACIKLERTRASGASSVMAKAAKGKKLRIKGKTQCGPDTKSKITLVKRNDGKAHEAQKHFATALSLYRSHGKSVAGENEQVRAERVQLMNDAAAEARFMQGEEIYEKLLALPFPSNLVFSNNPRLKRRHEESVKKFEAWLKEKDKVLQTAQKVYQDVLQFKQAHWSIASSARIGQLFQNFADGLYTAPLPDTSAFINQLKGMGATKDQLQEFMDTFQNEYCDNLQDKAEPLEAKAIEGLKACLDTATNLSWYNEWSGLCEAELNQIKPNEYPLASEQRAEPGYVASRVDEGILIEDAE
jgi:TolA-binding protein